MKRQQAVAAAVAAPVAVEALLGADLMREGLERGDVFKEVDKEGREWFHMGRIRQWQQQLAQAAAGAAAPAAAVASGQEDG